MADYTLSAKITADASKFNKEFQSTQQKVEKMGTGMVSAGKGLNKWLTLPLLGVGVAATKVSMDFESSMSNVQALSGATGQDLQGLEDIARKMGKETNFSASEAADALGYMALAGWDADQMISGLEPTLKLAGAANMDLARTSDIVTDTLSMFGMEAGETARLTDVMAKAQSTSNTNVEQLGDALVYAGGSANAMGYDIEQTSALLGILANNGLKGSKAGTALNSVFRDMKNKTKDGAIEINGMNIAVEDVDGNFRSFTDILADTEGALDGLTPVQREAALSTIFGSQAMQGLNPLIKEGSSAIKLYEEDLRNSEGAASDMYDVMQNNLKGEFEKLKSATEEAAISLGQTLVPMIKATTEKIKELVDRFNALDDSTKENIVKIGLFAAALGPVLIVGGKVAGGISAIIGLFTGGAGLTAAVGGATAAVGGVGGAGLVGGLGALAVGAAPILAAVGGLALIVAGAKDVHDSLSEEAIPAVDLFGEGVSETTEKVVGDWIGMNDSFEITMKTMAMTGTEFSEEMKETIGGNFNELSTKVIEATQTEKDETLAILGEMYAQSGEMSALEIEEKLSRISEDYDNQIAINEEGQKRINEILETWKARGGELRQSESDEILAIQEKTKEDGVRVLSENQEEAQIILTRMKEQSGSISARQASEVVKNAKAQKDGAIAEAESEYDKRLGAAANLRAKGGWENEQAANEIIKEAKRQREGAISEANEQYNTIVDVAKEKSGEHVNAVDWSTGEILTKWEKWKVGVGEKVAAGNGKVDLAIAKLNEFMKTKLFDRKVKVEAKYSTLGSAISKMKEFMGTKLWNRKVSVQADANNQKYARGTNFAPGGVALVGEEGPELVDIPRGSKVYTATETQRMSTGIQSMGGSSSNYIFNLNDAVIKDSRDIRTIAKELAVEFNREVDFA